MKYVTVRVLQSNGSPWSNTRVAIFVHQFMASGMTEPQYTNSDGQASFDLDIDDGAEISIYVDGNERVSRGSVRSEYRVSI